MSLSISVPFSTSLKKCKTFMWSTTFIVSSWRCQTRWCLLPWFLICRSMCTIKWCWPEQYYELRSPDEPDVHGNMESHAWTWNRRPFFWIRSNEPICIQSPGSRQHRATLEGNSLWIGGGRHINRLTPITCLPLATTVHKLDEPRSLIEDVRPTPAAAKHVFSLSIFGS